jgi:hypothetical protein
MKMRALAGMTALVLVAACAGVTSAGRNASRASETPAASTQTTQAPLPAPRAQPTQQAQVTQSAPLPPPPAETQGPPVASGVTIAPAARPAPRNTDDDEVVVESTRQSQVPPPEGDPRTNSERMRDIRAWDQCVTRAQGRAESDPMRPSLTTPEELCTEALGMASRTAVPDSRSRRR